MYILCLIWIYAYDAFLSHNMKVNLDFKKGVFFEKKLEQNIKFEDNERYYENIDNMYVNMGKDLKNLESFLRFCTSRIKHINNVIFLLPTCHQNITREFMEKVYRFCDYFKLKKYNFIYSHNLDVVEEYYIPRKQLYIDKYLLDGFIKFEEHKGVFFTWKDTNKYSVHAVYINTSKTMNNEEISLSLKKIKPYISICEEIIINIDALDNHITHLLNNMKEQKIIFKFYNPENMRNNLLLKLDVYYINEEDIKIHIDHISKIITIEILKINQNILEMFDTQFIQKYVFHINTPNISYCLNMAEKTLIIDKHNDIYEPPIFNITDMIAKELIKKCNINEPNSKIYADFNKKNIHISILDMSALEDINIFSIFKFKNHYHIDDSVPDVQNPHSNMENLEKMKVDKICEIKGNVSIYTNYIKSISEYDIEYSVQDIKNQHKNPHMKKLDMEDLESYTDTNMDSNISILMDDMKISSILENDYHIDMDLYIPINEENLVKIHKIFQDILSENLSIENAKITLNFSIEIIEEQENIKNMFIPIIKLNEEYDYDFINISYITEHKKHYLTYTQFIKEEKTYPYKYRNFIE